MPPMAEETNKTKATAPTASKSNENSNQKAKTEVPASKTSARKRARMSKSSQGTKDNIAKPTSRETSAKKPSSMSKSSHGTEDNTANPKSDTPASTEQSNPTALWDSVLAMAQAIEGYEDLKRTRYHGHDDIQQTLGAIGLQIETLKLRVLRHADGRLELLLSGMQEEAGETHGFKSEFVLELSRGQLFHEDVEIEEYADAVAVEEIEKVVGDLDQEHLVAVLYEHPRGLVEYLLSGPTMSTNATVHATVEQADNGVPRSKNSANGGASKASEANTPPLQPQSLESLLASGKSLDMPDGTEVPVPSATIQSEKPNDIIQPKAKIGKRKRFTEHKDEAPVEHSAPQMKKVRKDLAGDGQSAAFKKTLMVKLRVPSDKLAAVLRKGQTSHKGSKEDESQTSTSGHSTINHESPSSPKSKPQPTKRNRDADNEKLTEAKNGVPTTSGTSTPPAKGKRARNEDTDFEDDVPLAKCTRKEAPTVSAAKKDQRKSAAPKRSVSTGSNRQAQEARLSEVNTHATGESETTPNRPDPATVVTEITAQLQRGPTKAPAPPTSSTSTARVSNAGEEHTTASEAAQPSTTNSQVEESDTTISGSDADQASTTPPATSESSALSTANHEIKDEATAISKPDKKGKGSAKKVPPSAGNRRRYAKAGNDLGDERPVKQVKKRLHDDDEADDEDGGSKQVKKRVRDGDEADEGDGGSRKRSRKS